MARVHRRIAAPVLRDLRIEARGLAVDLDTVVPRRLPDLFPGAPLVVSGRFRGRVGGSIVVAAQDDAGIPWSQTLPVSTAADPAIAAVWARAEVRELEDRYLVGDDERATLERRIVATSLRFSVLSRFTAYVAIDRGSPANPGGEVHRIVQPVELPSGWDMPAASLGATGAFSFFLDCSAPMASAPAVMSRSLLRLPKAAPPVPPEPLDLCAFRARAKQLLASLGTVEALPPAARFRALAVLALKLAELIEDLASVEADEAERESLAKLVADVRRLVKAGTADEAELARLWREVHEVLEAFGAGKPQETGRKRRSFWK